ncbi:hypothetical protein ACX0G9_18970 [Flavitalea flava]
MEEAKINISGISENLSDIIAEGTINEQVKIKNNLLHDKQIAISVSESEEIDFLGLSDHHIIDISVELARYLFANGAKLLYGGDLRNGGFTEIFSDLSYQYKFLKDKEFRFVNYFPFPTSRQITLPIKADFRKKQIEVKILDIPEHINGIDQEREYVPANFEDRYIIAECLTDMRLKMAQESNARIILGGRQTGFDGYYPGIVEEAYCTLKADKPLYIIGGFGGAAKSIISLIGGASPEQLTNEFQFRLEQNSHFKEYIDKKGVVPYDYSRLTGFFQQYDIKSISELNGLSMKENEILFESTNIHEIIFILIKGLKRIFDK